VTIKRVLAGVAVVFVAVLAVIIGQRMSTDAMAVVIGVIFGVAASIPTSLLVAAVTRRAQGRRVEEEWGPRERAQPPVIVVNPGGSQAAPWFSPYQTPALPPSLHGEPTRSFRVVGGEEIAVDGESGDSRSEATSRDPVRTRYPFPDWLT
jgi:hypothetical protein